MPKRVLITGGAGFMGSHLADELLQHGYEVVAMDNLSPQVHGANMRRPDYLSDEVELLVGDIRDSSYVKNALVNIDVVYHFAALDGVGQSMYEVSRYTDTNDFGTSVLLQALSSSMVEKLVVASSMSVYGEGLYEDVRGNNIEKGRSFDQMQAGEWEVLDEGGLPLTPVATPETKTPSLPSISALTKYSQEQMCLIMGRALKIPVVGLRFFNVFGPRQSLLNPYTGVLAIFASRYINNKPPVILEDGRQLRDFVSVHDAVRACRLALESPEARDVVLNIGSGTSVTVREAADQMAEVLGKKDLKPLVTGRSRVGDVRHCFADISLAKNVLRYEPQVTLKEGLVELADWLVGQIAYDSVDKANAQLAQRGLTI